MALGYRLPGTIIEEVSQITTGRPTSPQRTPCFIGKASKYKKVEYEEKTRSSVSDTDMLTYTSTGVHDVISVGSQRGLSDFIENTHFELTSTGGIKWKINQELKVVSAGAVGNDLISALNVTLDSAVPGHNATSGYQGWGFAATKTLTSASGLTDQRTAGYQEWGFTAGKTVASASGLANDATRASHIGTSDMSSGHDWASANDTFSIDVDGGGATVITLNVSCANLSEVVSHISSRLSAAGLSAEAFDGGSNRVGIRGTAYGLTHTIVLAAGGGTVLTTLGMTAATYTGTNGTAYTCSISINGTPNAVTVYGFQAQTLQQVINEINADLSGAVASWNATGNGFIKVTSSSVGASSAIVITDTNLFGSLTDGNIAAEAAVAGSNGTAYTATITVDGGANAISFYGYEALTIGTVITEINSDLTGALATLDTVNNQILVTSSSSGATSTIAIANTNLFTSLTDANGAASTAVDGTAAAAGYQEFGLSTSTGAVTPISGNTRYYFKINTSEYMVTTGSGTTTYGALVSLMHTVTNPAGYSTTFTGGDIKITNNTAGSGYDVVITAGTTRTATNGELTITLSSGLTYARYAGKCQVLFTPDGGTTNYTFGIREDVSAGATMVTLTGTEAALRLVDQSGTGTQNDLTFKNVFIVAGAKYYVTYDYNRPTSDYLKYKEFIRYEDVTADLGVEIPAHDLVMIAKVSLEVFGIPKIAVVQVPYAQDGSVANVSYIDALPVIRYRDVQTVCALNTNSNVQSAIKAHVLESSLPENGRYRMMWTGAASGTPVGDESNPNSLRGKAVALKHERCVLVNATRANYYYVDPDTGTELSTVVDGAFIAAVFASYRDSIVSPVATLLNQTIPMVELLSEDYDDYYSEYQMTQAGSSSVFLTAPAGGLTKIIDDLTTDNSTVEKNNINIITAKDYIARDVAIQMDRTFKGQLIKDRSQYQSAVQGYLVDLFKQYKANSVIEKIGTISVNLPTTQRDTVEIFYSYYAVYTHKYTVGRFAIVI